MALNHPHRRFLINRILSYLPISSVLEVGCDSGVNLYLLASANPSIKLWGIDINKKVIEEGKDIIKEMGINNVFLSCGRADSLESFGDKSIDVVFTDAVLMYIGPNKIYSVIGEMIRVARKAVVFNEWHISSDEKESLYYYGHWVYNFYSLISKHVSPDKIQITRIPKEVWGDRGWETFGSLIEVEVLTR